MAQLLAHYRGLPPVTRLGSLEKAFANARSREPAMKIAFIAFPGTAFSSEHHYGVFMRGRTALTERLVKPVLVDAITGEVTASREPPWYVDALLLSQPLHFGDYGGVPMQWLWAVAGRAHDRRAGQRALPVAGQARPGAPGARPPTCGARRDEGRPSGRRGAGRWRSRSSAASASSAASWATARGTGSPGSGWACPASPRCGSACADGRRADLR